MEKGSKIDGILIGIKAAVISSLCCATPLLLVPVFILLGIGSVSAALRIPKYKAYFVLLGLIFLIISIWYYLKKTNKGVCNINTVYNNKHIVISAVITYVILAIIIIYILLPLIAQLIYSLI